MTMRSYWKESKGRSRYGKRIITRPVIIVMIRSFWIPVTVYDPYVSECMRFKVDSKSYYGEEAYQAWLEDMRSYLGGYERGKENT